MSKKFNGAIDLATGFNVSDPQPLDDRLVVETTADLTGAALVNAYPGITVAVESEGYTTYRWNGSDRTVLSNWEKVVSTPDVAIYTSVNDIAELKAYAGDADKVYVVAEDATYYRSNLVQNQVAGDDVKVVESTANRKVWVRQSNSTVLNLRDLPGSDGLGGTDDTAVFKRAFDACNDTDIFAVNANNTAGNPHYDTVYIPQGDYRISETITIRCNVLSSPRALIRFDQPSTIDTDWRDKRVMFQIGTTASDYSYQTDLYSDEDDPFIGFEGTTKPFDLHRWYDFDYIKKLGSFDDVNTTACFVYPSNATTNAFFNGMNQLLVDETRGHFQFINLEIDKANRTMTGITERIPNAVPATDVMPLVSPGQKIKVLIVNYDGSDNPLDGRIFEKNYWDEVTPTVNNDNGTGTQWIVNFRLSDADLRDIYGDDNGTVEIIQTVATRRAYVFWDSGNTYRYFAEPDCTVKDENYTIPRVVYADFDTKCLFFDSSGRFMVDEPNNVSPYMRAKIRTSSEARAKEIKGYSIELPDLIHTVGGKVFPLFPSFQNVETGYSTALLVNGIKNCYVKVIDCRFFDTYQHLRGGSELNSFTGVIGSTFYGGNCANNRRQLEIRPFRANGLKTGGYVNSNRFVDYTCNLAANSFIKDTAYATADIAAESIVRSSTIYGILPPATQALYNANDKFLCITFASQNPGLRNPSRIANSDFSALSPTIDFGNDTVTFNGTIANNGWTGVGDQLYITHDEQETPLYWGEVTGVSGNTELTIDSTGTTWDGLGDNVRVLFYEDFDITRVKPNYYVDVNNTTTGLNRAAEFRIDHVVELTDNRWAIITNWGVDENGVSSDIYGETRIAKSAFIEESPADLYVEVRYARLGSHPTHVDPTLPDFSRKNFTIIGMYGNPQVGLGSPNGNGFYNCIFEEHSGLGWITYDIVGSRYIRFVHVRAEVTLNRLPKKEFTNVIYLDGCDKIMFDSGTFMDKSILKIDERTLNLSKRSGAIFFEANNQQVNDFIDVEYDDINSTILQPVYKEEPGNVLIKNVNFEFGENSIVKFKKKVFMPASLNVDIIQDYNKQLVELRYSNEITLGNTDDGFTTEVINSGFTNVEVKTSGDATFNTKSTDTLVTITGIGTATISAPRTHVVSKGVAKIINTGDNTYIITGDLGGESGLNDTYQSIIDDYDAALAAGPGVPGSGSIDSQLSDTQKAKQSALVATLEGTQLTGTTSGDILWNKISKMGVFGGGVEDMSLLDWKDPSTIANHFNLTSNNIIIDGPVTEYVFDSNFALTSGATFFSVNNGSLDYNITVGGRDNCARFTMGTPAGGRTLTYANPAVLVDQSRYHIQFEMYIPNGQNLDGYVVRCEDNGSNDTLQETTPPYDTWFDVSYYPSSGTLGLFTDGAGGGEIRIRPLGNSTTIGAADVPTDVLYIRNFSITPIGEDTAINNTWSEQFGYTANKTGFIETRTNLLNGATGIPNSNLTLYTFQSEPALRAADFVQDALTNELEASLRYENDADGNPEFQNIVVFNGEIANQGFGVGSIIYFSDDIGNSRLGTVISSTVSNSTPEYPGVDSTICEVENGLRVPGNNARYKTIEALANQVIMGHADSKYLRLYADSRTTFVGLYETVIDEGVGRIYVDTELNPSLALTRRAATPNVLELFQGGTTTTYNIPFVRNDTATKDVLLMRSEEAIAYDYSIGAYVVASELTEEELVVLQEVFETYYS